MQPDFSNAKQVLALTLYGEIRGGDTRAKEHVANVIFNRVHHPGWWGKTIVGVCMAPWQFSCWWLKDANHQSMMDVAESDPTYQACAAVAAQGLAGLLTDDTHGATSYYAVGTPAPSWASRSTMTITDGYHNFFTTQVPDVPHTSDPGTPTVSIHADPDTSADALNNVEIQRLKNFQGLNPPVAEA